MHQTTIPAHLSSSRLALSLLVCVIIGVYGVGCSKAAREARHLDKGEEYFKEGQLEKAEIEFLNVYRANAQNTQAVVRLGSIYHSQHRVRPAFQFLSRAKQIVPDDLESRTKLAALVTFAGQAAAAREELLIIASKDPKQVDAILLLAETAFTPAQIKETRDVLQKVRPQVGDHAMLHTAEGMLLLRENKNAAAEQAFIRARTIDPKFAPAFLGLGGIYWQSNDLASADKMLKTAADLSAPRSLRQMPWVDFKIKTGAPKVALSHLEEFVKKTPDFVPALNRLAELQFDSGQTNECMANVTKALSLDPESYEARALLGRIKMTRGQFAEAVQEFERLRSLYPKLPLVHYQLGRAYLLNREGLKAVDSLEDAVNLGTNLYEPTILLADLKTRQGDAARSIGLLSDVVKHRPKDEQAWYLLASAYRVGKRPDDALNIYRRLARDFPTNPLAPLFTGAILREQNKPAEARKALESALRISPNLPSAIIDLVDLDLAETNTVSALQRTQQALEKNPRSAPLHFALAKVLFAKGESAQAEAALRKSLELAPDYQDAYIALARMLVGNKKPAEALEELNRALAKNPKDTSTLMLMGTLYGANSEFTKARDAYEKLLSIQPQSSVALNNLAYLYAVRLKEPDKALDYARKARQLLPDEPAVADTLGWATYLKGDYAGALPLLQEASSKLPNVAEAQYHVGMAHYMMGNEAEARIALQRATQGAADFPGKDEANQKLLALGGQGSMPADKMIQALEKSLSENPNDVLVLLRLSALYEQTGALDKAQLLSEKALNQNPKAVRAMLILARIHAAKPNSARALEYAKNARMAAPSDLETAHAAGRAAFQAGQFEWAHSVLQDTYRRESDNPELAYDFAWSTYVVGRVAEAEAAMQAALRGGTNFLRADLAKRFLNTIALTRDTSRLTQEGARIQEMLKADSGYLPALMAAAAVWEHQKGYAEARKYYEQILNRYPQFTPATRNLALLCAEHLDDTAKGYELATKARQSFPGDTQLAQALGKLAHRRGEHELAVRLLREVQQKNAATAETYFYLGLSQAQLKQKAESATSLRQALSMNLDPKLAEQAQRVLTENTK